jgi:superfamily II DNA or RNA helicase
LRNDLYLSLRSWQQAAYQQYFRAPGRDFLLVATPGAGKTSCALTIAAELLARRQIAAITVVTPTEHLKFQWSQAAIGFGISLDAAYRNAQGRVSADYAGVAVTYAQVAAHPALHRQRTEARRTLVIFDEIHHTGDALSWGEAVSEAFQPATRRMGLTGTPFRSDANPIPFVTYAPDAEGNLRSMPDYSYGYGPALDDAVVRPVIFLAYSGEMTWRTRAGDEISGTLGAPMTADQLAQAWRTALDPQGDWVARMVSEGVDIPRLAVGVYATSVGTALFFAQAVGRFVRARRRGETASVFLPSIPVLLGYAAELEAERDHVLRRQDDPDAEERELAEARRQRDTADQSDDPPFLALGASAHFDRVLYDGNEFGVSAEDEDFLGLPGLLEPDQVALLLRKRHADQLSKRAGHHGSATDPAKTADRSLAGGAAGGSAAGGSAALPALRGELNGLVRAWHHQTGLPHNVIHADLRRSCGGPPLPQATSEQVRARIETIRRWSAERR